MSKTVRFDAENPQRRPTLYVVEQFNAATGRWHVAERARHQGTAEQALQVRLIAGHMVRISQA